MLADKKIVLVYDRVNTAFGGAENVLLALKKLYPQADLATSVYRAKTASWADDFQVKTSFLQKLPFARGHHRLMVNLMPLAFESLDLSTYDIIISVTSGEAKAVVTRADQFHLCYLLSPPRYLYHYQTNYWQHHPVLAWPIIKQLAQASLTYLTKRDQLAIHRPDQIVTIAQAVNRRLQHYYQLPAQPVIYPPVDSQLFTQLISQNQPTTGRANYYLVVSRLVPYKNVDLAIRACVQAQRQLIIVGDGPDYTRLLALKRQLIGRHSKQIVLKKQVSSKQLSQLYSQAQALLMPGVDDFGITALEANLHGLPVIINQHSGASEILTSGQEELQLKFPEQLVATEQQQYVDELCLQMRQLENKTFDRQTLQKNALKYDTTNFMRLFHQQLINSYRKYFDEK